MWQVVRGWPELPPGEMLGQATGVAVGAGGEIIVFHRAGRLWSEPFPTEPIAATTLWSFDPATGERIRAWGQGLFVMPHGLTVDARGDLWVTDVGTHQVHKFAADGRHLLTLGEKGVAGEDDGHFNMPTDVAIAPDGRVYVSDGYGNARVVVFDADGRFLFAWGRKGTGEGEFDLPHAIAIDDGGRVHVADRSNARIQLFTAEGRFLSQWRDQHLGRPYSLALFGPDRAVVVDGGDQPDAFPDRSGAVVVDRAGRVISTFGRFGNYDGQFQLAHDVAVSTDGAIYVVDAWGERVQKFLAREGTR